MNREKELYESPIIEVMNLRLDDIITSSGYDDAEVPPVPISEEQMGEY